MRSFRSSKYLKTTVELTFTTQKGNACSLGLFVLSSNGNTFLRRFGPKTQNYQFELKFCTQTNSNIQNSTVMSTFSVFDQKYFQGKFGIKNKNCQFELTPDQFEYAELYRKMGVFIFSALGQKNTFWVNLVKKNQNCQFKRKFATATNLNLRNSMMMFTFSVFDRKYLLGQIRSKKSKLSV